MTITLFERSASILEMAVEIDRRGAVIEALEAEIERLRGLFKIQTDSHAKHVKGIHQQHGAEREIYGDAAQALRERAETAEAERDAMRDALDTYEEQTSKLPLGHEDATRGMSSYNWRRKVVADLRNLAGSWPGKRRAIPTRTVTVQGVKHDPICKAAD